ncbi:MAG TPA: signal peptide peptidase SppA [Verrucomicrobiae bacterium]|nr:signal peptide peptidase SppA [Verrucomicrobiae bacterium]
MDSNEVPPNFSTPPPPHVPSTPPPIIAPAARAPQPKRGRGWMIFALVLLALLIISVLANFGQLASTITRVGGGHSRTAGPRLDEAILEDNNASAKIAVIDVDGIITSRAMDQSGFTMADLIKTQLERAKEDSQVKAVVLRVDSPGGEVLASDEINRVITDFQKESKKPVVASMGNLAASGGYYISAPCRWIVANELTITGSIGVIMHTWNYRGLMNKVGLQPQVFKSGKFKDMLSGERDLSQIPEEEREEERRMVQGLIDETYNRFKEVVATGRAEAHRLNEDEGRPLADNWADYADGRVLSGSQAHELGFVDSLGNFQDAVKKAAELGGIGAATHANLIRYQQRYDISDLFNIFGKSDAKVVKIDLGMEAPKLQAGALYFLMPTAVP